MSWASRPSVCWLLALSLLVACSESNDANPASSSGEGRMAMKSKVQVELVGRLPRKPGGGVGHMTLHGKHVYLVNEDAGLQLVDVSNPAAPKVVGSYQPKGYLGRVAVSGDHACR